MSVVPPSASNPRPGEYNPYGAAQLDPMSAPPDASMMPKGPALVALSQTPQYSRTQLEKQSGSMTDAQYYGLLQSKLDGTGTAQAATANSRLKSTGTSSTAKRTSSGGGGGGGGSVAPKLTQAQLDQMWGLIGAGRPAAETVGAAYAPTVTPFNGSQYDTLLSNFNTAVAGDRSTANQAYGDLGNYLTSNYQNAYSNPGAYAQMGNAPGQTQQAMARMLQSQGQNAQQLMQPAQSSAQGADTAFGNLLAILSGNENQAQQNRLNEVQMDKAYTGRALDASALAGQTGIGQQRAQAQQAWQANADQVNQQAALANWQRQNQVADTNYTNTNSYNNTELSTLLTTLLPQIIAGRLTMPTAAQMFGTPA